ncbi:MAG: bifunctional YncE family protein/alkaline phosphatase family protein [Acidobacteria bacterium]|nr:bifunctional YncE family protein/alkaline phosphatase family protein [Acidobacteriota bacterium]
MNVNSRRLAVLLLTAVLIVPTVRIQVAAGVIPIDFQARTVSPAGKLIVDAETKLPAVMPLTFNFVRSPDSSGADGKGRYLIAVNSGYGLTFNSGSKNQQTLSVIDLTLRPEPQVIQNVYFPAPQSANFGLVFDSKPQASGKFNLYLSGGFENKIWILSFDPSAAKPLSPANAPDTEVKAPFIDVAAFAENAPTPNYNDNVAAVYPTGIDLSPDGTALFVANNLGDSLGVISDLRDQRRIVRIKLGRPGSKQFVYPYDVKIKPSLNGKTAGKIYVSCWGDGKVAVVDGATNRVRKHIAVGRHPTQMLFNHDRSRLYVVNSDGDSVSVIDTALDAEAAREPKINVRLSDQGPGGVGPQGIALSDDEKTLFVANSKTNAVAVVGLDPKMRSRVKGFIPTANYASAVAFVNGKLFIANGKGTGMGNSSNTPNLTGLYPNMPNKAFPADRYNKRGVYSAAIVSGGVSLVDLPDEKQLFAYTQQVMRDNGMLGERKPLFPNGRSPFKHIIYVIRENRTYDQVFGDLERSGDGTKADGESSVAIFGAGDAAKSPGGEPQDITPNARALALRFGLLDRFFVNAEASPDGHNWSTAAFSNDYVDKAFRWDYSGRGRTYDYEGFNRLPSFNPPGGQPPVSLPPVFDIPATADDVVSFQKRYVPYVNGARDISEPETLYLWDAAQRAGLNYRNYGEFIGTVSENDLRELNTRKRKTYPDLSPTLAAFATKKSLEGHFSPAHRNYDLTTPDSMTVDSYRAARASDGRVDAAISNANKDFKGNSRFGEWQREFRGFVEELERTKIDRFPNLSIVRLSNDHTAGMSRWAPTPQFFVAENDYALGRLVEEVSNSPYWKDTAIFVVEDDAQDGPDHVDAHRSPAFVISAWNREGALVHEFHSTVSLIRTLELCIGINPMNFLDANAIPIDVFGDKPNLTPYRAILPTVALDNLMPPPNPTRAMLRYMELTNEQNLTRADMADPRALNEIIWFSVKGDREKMPEIARLPAFDVLTAGVREEDDDEDADDDD